MQSPTGTTPARDDEVGADDEQIRSENDADQAAMQGWAEFELSWRTHRWMPAGTARWIGAVGLIYLAIQTAILFPPGPFLADSGPVLGLIFWDAFVALLIYGLILVVPSAHERESAAWSIYGTSDYIRISKVPSRGNAVDAELSRVDAGELAIGVTWVEEGRARGHWTFESAAGRSVDGTVELVLPRLTAPLRGWSLLDRPQPQRILVSWWPLNARSREALKQYEKAGFDYWSPEGFAPTHRVLHVSGQGEPQQ